MHAINVYTNEDKPLCLFSCGSRDLETIINLVYKSDYRILSIIPLNHLLPNQSNYFRFICVDTETDDIIEFQSDYYNLDKIRKRKDLAIIRVFPIF